MNYDFHVVGIGLSAGGLDPLLEIVADLPRDIGAAFVIVAHVPINAPSSLDVILSKATPLKVMTVSTIEYVEPGHMYVMAAGKEIILVDGFVQIRERNPQEKINKTVDIFFKSLAADAKDKSIGIVLSGAGHDGIEGAKSIEDYNGLVIVQDPETAKFPLMPGNLIANDHPDYVLKPEDIAKRIVARIQERV